MDNIKDTISNVTKNVYKTSKGFIKSTKLSMDLAGEESKLKAIYHDIGKKVHEIYAYGGSLGKFFDEKYKELLECEQNIDSLRKELDSAKGTRTCPKCGKTAQVTAEFCPKCGTRMDESTENVAFSAPPAPPSPAAPGYGYSLQPQAQGGYPPTGSYPSAPPAEYPASPASSYPAEVYEVPRPAEPAPESYYQPAGAPVATSKVCPVCGKENAVENKFCYSCGRAI